MSSDKYSDKIDDDKDVRELLQRAGHRPAPPEDVSARVFEAVQQAWQETAISSAVDSEDISGHDTAGQTWWRSGGITAIAASVVVMVALALVYPLLGGKAEVPSANVILAKGSVTINGTILSGADSESGVALYSGAEIQTGKSGSVALQLSDSTELRLDELSVATIINADEIRLYSGRLYIDSRDKGHSVTVYTHLGEVSDIGTQFEVALERETLLASVREGEIQLRSNGESFKATAKDGVGQRLELTAGEQPARSTVPTISEDWHWTKAAGKPLELEASTLSAFLQWSARENGYSLRYSSPAVASAAASTHLFGELAELDEALAIDAVLATTTFRKLDSAAHELVIDFQR